MHGIFLLALQLGYITRHLLVLPAHLGKLCAHHIQLALQVNQAALQLRRLFGRAPRLLSQLLLCNLNFLPQVQNGLARFLVIEKTRRGIAHASHHQGGSGRHTAQLHD